MTRPSADPGQRRTPEDILTRMEVLARTSHAETADWTGAIREMLTLRQHLDSLGMTRFEQDERWIQCQSELLARRPTAPASGAGADEGGVVHDTTPVAFPGGAGAPPHAAARPGRASPRPGRTPPVPPSAATRPSAASPTPARPEPKAARTQSAAGRPAAPPPPAEPAVQPIPPRFTLRGTPGVPANPTSAAPGSAPPPPAPTPAPAAAPRAAPGSAVPPGPAPQAVIARPAPPVLPRPGSDQPVSSSLPPEPPHPAAPLPEAQHQAEAAEYRRLKLIIIDGIESAAGAGDRRAKLPTVERLKVLWSRIGSTGAEEEALRLRFEAACARFDHSV